MTYINNKLMKNFRRSSNEVIIKLNLIKNMFTWK
jgi:hypothetical protein